jgi:hydrogenase/urease accessory protein HupE
MQDWDRIAMVGVGLLVSIYTGWQSRQLWKKRKVLPLVGVGLLMLIAVGLPTVLSLVSR